MASRSPDGPCDLPDDAPSDPPGDITVGFRGGVLTVRVAGEVDLWLRGRLRDALVAIARHGGPVELDLRGVTFFGAEGVNMLLAMYHAGPPGTVGLVATSPAVDRTLRVCGMSRDALQRHHGGS